MLSIRWKSFIFISILLTILSVSFGVFNYIYLNSIYEHQSKKQLASYELQLKNTIANISNQLLQRGEAILIFGQAEYPAFPIPKKGKEAAFKKIENMAEKTYLTQVEFFDENQKSIWSTPNKVFTSFLKESMDVVQKTEVPTSKVRCYLQECYFVAFFPIFINNKTGVGVVVQSIANLVIDFHSGTGTNLGILVDSNVNSDVRFLQDWGKSVVALTNAPLVFPVIHSFSQTNKLIFKKNNTYEYLGHTYRIYVMSSSQGDLNNTHDGNIVFVTDITETVQSLKYFILLTVAFGVGFLVISEMLALMLTGGSVRKLRQLSDTLPLLAHGNYQEAREHISKEISQTKRYTDEIGLLYDTSLVLSDQLESNAKAITERTHELEAEKDFVSNLLDAAQVPVIMLSKDGIIKNVNQFGYHLGGYAANQVLGKSFFEFIQDDNMEEVRAGIQALVRLDRRKYDHESLMRRRDGTLLKILWVHTRLHLEHNGEAILSVGMDITERAIAEEQARWLANHDSLTSLMNRARFAEELQRIYAETMRNKTVAALLFFDLDGFKEVNDTSGHDAGDKVLCAVADELRNRVRATDVVARLGGDEFVVLSPMTDKDQAIAFAKVLLSSLKTMNFVYRGRHHNIAASIGIAPIPKSGNTPKSIITAADYAMYKAKKAGGDRYYVYEK